MKNLFFAYCLVIVFVSCSADNNPDDPLQEAHFHLTLDGAEFENMRIAVDRKALNILNSNRIAISAGDEGLVNFFGFYLPFPVESTTYTMVEGSSPSQNTAFYSRNQTDTYYTESGTISINDIFENDACQILSGSLNINLSHSNDPSQVLNVSGTFEIPTEECQSGIHF
ncbi:hypothetical protein [Cyclobacterium roseum]|uniref:hypothetical protein n=1 Tax=Cyclobacterium roseum TaxID=2666137 RepID=UPI0013909FE3|nr:hypothetical protein [Cyclobacterium roseum]